MFQSFYKIEIRVIASDHVKLCRDPRVYDVSQLTFAALLVAIRAFMMCRHECFAVTR
jgi:hypothetical protein